MANPARAYARRIRRMKHWTKVAYGLVPRPKPPKPEATAAILKSLYPQRRIGPLTFGSRARVRPVWARIAASRGWMTMKAYLALATTVVVDAKSFYAFVSGTPKRDDEPFDLTAEQYREICRAYPLPAGDWED